MIFTRERFKCHQGVMSIPCPHFKITIVKRSQGQSAVAGAAYQSGEWLFSEYDQKTKFYNKKKELVHAEIMLPSHAPPGYADRATLWNAVEAVENQWNSQLARRIVLAFPVEVPKEQYLKMIREFCQEQFVSKGMIADFAIHDKGDGNPHAHILLTLRAMDEHGKWLPKSRSENIADNKKEFYEISLTESYSPFAFLDDAEKRTEYYSESDRNKLSGFLFKINLNDQYFWVYQHIYSVSRIDRSKNIIARLTGDTYDEIDSDIVQIDSRADIIIFSSSVVTAKMDLMQRFFGFEQYIRAGAQKTIEIIRNLNIVDSLEKFVAFENKSKLTNAKKLLKAKNSPVLQMKKNDLLENLKKHSRYKTMFKFEEDHIVISSQKEAAAFIKMLNDDIVRSELTGKEYDSSSKMLLGPVGASQ